MSSRPTPFALALLLGGILALDACEGKTPWRGERTDQETAARPDFGPTAAYDRRFIFLGPGGKLPTTAVFDFTALADSAGVRRGERVHVVDGSEWAPLLDVGWRAEPLREPWRIVPHGPLKLVVGDGGDISSLVFRGDPSLRLEPGATLAEDAPDAGTQLVLREAMLRVNGHLTTGVLLDAQLGRAVNATLAREIARYGAEADSAAAEAARHRDDGQTGPVLAKTDPTAIARIGAEGFLLDNAGYYVVFATSADGDLAWMHDGEGDDVRRGAQLKPSAWADFHEGGVQFPTAWSVEGASGALTGELQTAAADREVLHGTPELSALGYVLVTGWIEDRGLRREVFGLVRQVR